MKRAAPIFACAFVLLLMLVTRSQGTEDISGTVASVDTGRNVITLDDGRQVQVIPGAVILIEGRPAAMTALVPGTRVMIRQAQLMNPASGATTQTQGSESVTVQVPAPRLTVQIPRQTVVVEQQAPQITVQQQPPEVVMQPGPAPQVQVAPSPRAQVTPPSPPRAARVLEPVDRAAPLEPQVSENRYVIEAPAVAQRPSGPTQTARVVAPPPPAAQATVPPAASPPTAGEAIVTPMLIIAEPPVAEAPAAAPRPMVATGPWSYCDDSLFKSRTRLFIDWVFRSCQAP